MPPTQTGSPGTDDARTNELYWSTDMPIADLTRELGISRNALYSSIHPIAARASCPECDERMVFTNRTNRDSGKATCRACGTEMEGASSAHAHLAGADGETRTRESWRGDEDGAADEHGWSRWRQDLAGVDPERYALVGVAAALGLVVGAAAARALRTR